MLFVVTGFKYPFELLKEKIAFTLVVFEQNEMPKI